MKAIARLISRGIDSSDGLLIGVKLKGGSFFEPNSVYEIVDIDGAHVIRRVGESVVANSFTKEPHSASPIGKTWGSSVNDLLTQGPSLFLSRDEYNQAYPEIALDMD